MDDSLLCTNLLQRPVTPVVDKLRQQKQATGLNYSCVSATRWQSDLNQFRWFGQISSLETIAAALNESDHTPARNKKLIVVAIKIKIKIEIELFRWHRFVRPVKQGWSLYLPCILVRYRNDLPNQAKCFCYLDSGKRGNGHLGPSLHPTLKFNGYSHTRGQKYLWALNLRNWWNMHLINLGSLDN